MKKVCIIILIILSCSLSIGNVLYVSKGNVFEGFFTNPYEECVFVMDDGNFYVFTTMDEGFISGEVSMFYTALEADGYTIYNVMIVMHNHFANPFPSAPDKNTLTRMRMSGFDGKFGIYVTATKQIHWVKE